MFPSRAVVWWSIDWGCSKTPRAWFCVQVGLYGALVPAASWIDVVMAHSESKPKGLLKGIAYSFCGLFAFLAIFAMFLPSATPKELLTERIQPIALVSADSSVLTSPHQSLLVVPAKEESHIAAATPSVNKPKFLGESRVLIDPNNDEEARL